MHIKESHIHFNQIRVKPSTLVNMQDEERTV
jgi:ribosomal 50S subunit-recycling heat shock protein